MYTSKYFDDTLKITLDTVLERDMDLLIMEEFLAEKDFANLFLDAANIDRESQIISMQRSLRVNMGESDIVILLKTQTDKTVALHIEDKVNAEAQQEQYARYEERAKFLSAGLNYSDFRICITAPQHYLDANEEAKKYPYCVSYEKLKDYFEKKNTARSKFKLALLYCALNKKDLTISVPNTEVTNFWNSFEKMAQNLGLCMNTNADLHGTESKFIRFKTAIPKVFVIYKARQGNIDLQFTGKANKIFIPRILLENDMIFTVANKSAVVRISNPQWRINLEDDIANHHEIICDILEKIKKLVTLAETIYNKYPELLNF